MWIPIEGADIDVGKIETAVGGAGGRATADDVQKVYDATSSCSTVPEIVETTGLAADIVDECISTLKTLGLVAEESGGRMCNVEAACSLCRQFDRIRKICD